MEPYEHSQNVFTAIDKSVGDSEPLSKPDFFISVGDIVNENLENDPFTFDDKRSYMSSENLKDVPVFVTRGNLDSATLHWSAMVEASMMQDQFVYPSLYYSKIERLGALNSRIAFMFIDATLFLCSTHSVEEPQAYEAFRTEKCTDPSWTAWGDTQNKWIQKTLAQWNEDGSIMYRVLVSHFPMWSVTASHKPDEFAGLNTDLLPLLRDQMFDLYLSGHSVTSFANIKPDDSLTLKEQPEFESSLQSAETWFKLSSQDRFKGFD
jgi:hypothetical protein